MKLLIEFIPDWIDVQSIFSALELVAEDMHGSLFSDMPEIIKPIKQFLPKASESYYSYWWDDTIQRMAAMQYIGAGSVHSNEWESVALCLCYKLNQLTAMEDCYTISSEWLPVCKRIVNMWRETR